MGDRKHIQKLREKRLKALGKQVDKHEEKIVKESGRLDTTKNYWRKEIDEKFLKQMEKDKEYLGKLDEENEDGCSD